MDNSHMLLIVENKYRQNVEKNVDFQFVYYQRGNIVVVRGQHISQIRDFELLRSNQSELTVTSCLAY